MLGCRPWSIDTTAMRWLERRFALRDRGTTLGVEVRAGLTTFATMAYIIFVQPTTLAAGGMDFGAVLSATCLASALGCALMGLIANYPIALAPAMGHNIFFVFTVIIGLGVPWQIALGANCLAGIAFLVLSVVGLRERLVDAIPAGLKHAIAVGIGLLIALVGLEWGGIVVPHPGTLIGLGSLRTPAAEVTAAGLMVACALLARGSSLAILGGTLAALVAALGLGASRYQGIVAAPPSLAPTAFRLDLAGALAPPMWGTIAILFFLALFDTIGTLIGVSEQAGLLVDGRLERARRALIADSLAIIGGTLAGTSTVTCYVESAAGVAAGGRTGLTSLVVAACFLASLVLHPLARMAGTPLVMNGRNFYPVAAPALVIVGALMLSTVRKIDWQDPTEALPAFFTIALMPATFSIAEGIAFGFLATAVVKVAAGRAKECHPLLYACAALFALRYVLT